MQTLTTTKPPFLIGVAGGSGSGKTTVTERVIRTAGAGAVTVLALDSYYRDGASLPMEERLKINYDHPDAFDWELLLEHLDDLQRGQAIYSPIYDFNNYVRASSTFAILPAPIIVLEGIFILFEPRLRERFDLKVFVDTDPDVRFIRRMTRDVRERGRTPESVIEQYLQTVRPSHLQFVEPSKRYADVIIPHGGMNTPALDMLAARIQTVL